MVKMETLSVIVSGGLMVVTAALTVMSVLDAPSHSAASTDTSDAPVSQQNAIVPPVDHRCLSASGDCLFADGSHQPDVG